MLFPHSRRLARACALVVLLVRPVAHAQSASQSKSSDTLRLSLGEAVSIALRQSDEIGISAAQSEAADAAYGSARANALPQLRFNAAYLHTYESARGQAVGTVFNQPNTYTTNLNLSQPLFQGGRLVSAMRAGDNLRKAARFDETELRSALTVDVQRAYVTVLFADRIAQLQSQNLALATNRVTQVEQFERAGRAARYDVLRARVARTIIEPQVIQARNDRELAELELKRILNLPVDQPLSLVTHIDSGAVTGLLTSLGDTTTVAERASIRSAELTAAAKELGVAVARADFFPTVSVFFQTGYQAFPPIGQGFPTQFGALTAEACPPGGVAGRTCQNGGWFGDRQLGLNISMPVFDGFRVRSNVELAKTQAKLAQLQLRQQREDVSIEVAKARAELRRSTAVFAAQRQNALEADEAFRLAELRFSRGLSTQLEVSDAQLALLTAQSTEARATYDLFLASADVARALGRPIPIPSSATGPAAPR